MHATTLIVVVKHKNSNFAIQFTFKQLIKNQREEPIAVSILNVLIAKKA